jgi:Na+-transporting methylmalonyl-CoA/oxaloacetate decarboxylase gamma subunit
MGHLFFLNWLVKFTDLLETYMSELIQRAVELPWGYIMSTLLIRFVGVFLVLGILLAGMYLLGFVVSRLVARQEKRNAEKDKQETPSIAFAEEPEREADEEEMIAAIGAALAMAMESQQMPAALSPKTGLTAGSWVMAGRATQMNRRLQGGSQRHP